MATNYTEHYGLCQWEPGDKFVREEFNQDNAKIDAALKAAEEEITEAEARSTERLAAVGHDVYGLILQNYYDCKTTGWKKALVFDGFQDWSLVAEASESLFFMDKAVGLCREVQRLLGNGYGSGTIGHVGWVYSGRFISNGYGFINRVRVQTQQASATARDGYIQYNLQVADHSRKEGTFYMKFQNTPYENILDVGSVPVHPGDEIQFMVYMHDDTQLLYSAPEGGSQLGCYLDLSPVVGEVGSITTPALTLPDRSSLWAWIRHDGSNFTLTALGQNGEQEVFVPVGTRTAQKVDGTPCTELELHLATPPQSGNLTFRLQMELGESGQMRLYDYGILVL